MWFGNRKTDSDLCLLQFRTAKSTSLISPRILEYICNERTLPQVAGFFHNDAKATEREVGMKILFLAPYCLHKLGCKPL